MDNAARSDRRPWQRDELLLAMNLYCRLPFGRLHHRTPEIIRLAGALGRTPSSVAMKLSNLASLDPVQQARGVRGLSGASRADRAVWDEFHQDWERLAVESEALRERLVPDPPDALDPPPPARRPAPDITPPAHPFTGETEGTAPAAVRYAQRFFRRSVLASYGVRCCVTGNPVPQLLSASHILRWSDHPTHRADPRNGLCLAKTHDAAFDRGLITFDEDYRLRLSPYLRDFLPNEQIESDFVRNEGKPLRLPDRFRPEAEYLGQHRAAVFLA